MCYVIQNGEHRQYDYNVALKEKNFLVKGLYLIGQNIKYYVMNKL